MTLSAVQQLSVQDQSLYKSAVDLQHQDKVEQAIRVYRKVLRREPQAAQVWFDLATAYMQADDLNKAAQAYKCAYKLEPGNDDYERKAKAAAEALASPFVQNGFSQLSSSKSLRQKHASAIESFKKALMINPDDHVVWYHLGKSYEELKNHQSARMAFEKAIALYSDDAYKQALEEVGGKRLDRNVPPKDRFGDFGTGN